MRESTESLREYFIYPDIEAERDEFERVAHTFGLDADTLVFLAKEEGKLELLSEDVWGRLENTESHEFDKDEWRIVKEVSEAQERVRDWQKFKTLEEKGVPIDAPIILKCGDTYHLVSGNTRLMVAHALGITPKVLLFEYRHDRSDE